MAIRAIFLRLGVLAVGLPTLLGACAPGASGASSSPDPRLLSAIEAYNRGDVATAFQGLSALAAGGNSDAQVNLGYMYARGEAVPQDQAHALRLYELSAAQGNGEGMNALGYKYEYGTGVVPNMETAIHWYCAAIAKGNPRAMNNLAILLSEGKVVARDLPEAHALWLQSAERGHVNGMLNVGVTFITGEGVAADRAQGIAWLTRAAEHGQPAAQQKLAMLGVQRAWPASVDYLRVMQLQPRDAAPGRAKVCGALVS